MATYPHETERLETDRVHNNTIFKTLSEPRRRFSLRYLRVADTPVKVGDLAAEIAAWETRRPVDQSDDGTDAIETALVHNHLPLMDESGFIEYDHDQQTVALTDQIDEMQTHLKICGNN
ncbi:hypothetical protein [Natrinema sp. 1APR25-10V2]|uniref:DUF7344 domain-containing protein n=1 Tax=Natrinema sp. 1APR25-10V2 TaxID=2951081 RepID=UPI00287568A8|nr:hypothetical protein [Natrinema sp. 1APR25-10V2]MDS0477126.1 hypothetical protein [Natrinema sp. 1APR25-10V2]